MVQLVSTWTVFKTSLADKTLLPYMQYDDDGVIYTAFSFDGPLVYICTIWKGTVPSSVITSGYAQATNDADKTDFEDNYKSASNSSLRSVEIHDRRIRRLFGNKTTAATSEVLVASSYTEQGSQAQRSLVSSSANDKASPPDSGARVVRIEYLNSNYEYYTEDVNLNGTSAVNTAATDIRFVQAMYVIAGTVAAGTITMKSTTGGGGSDVCTIASATESAFMCHYYCPTGKRSWILGWGSTSDDETNMRLKSQTRINDFLVDINFDLEKLFFGDPTPPTRLTFERIYQGGCGIPAKTYTRITTAPNQATSTVNRSWLYILEEP